MGAHAVGKMKNAWLLGFSLLLASYAAAQGISRQSQVLVSGGFPNATVRVCTEPATAIPCTPIATIYSDPGLTQVMSNPLTTDASGNYAYFGSVGLTYHEQVSGAGLQTYDIPYITLPLSSAALLAANNTWTGTNKFSLGVQIGGALDQVASGNFAKSCNMSSTTSCTYTLTQSFTNSLCLPFALNSAAAATGTSGLPYCIVSGTTVTINAAASNSGSWAAIVVGNPN